MDLESKWKRVTGFICRMGVSYYLVRNLLQRQRNPPYEVIVGETDNGVERVRVK